MCLLAAAACPQWLIKRTRASFPRADGRDRTAVHYAARLGQTELLRWLLESGQYRQAGGAVLAAACPGGGGRAYLC